MKSTINSFYSLNGIGLRQFAMSPLSIAKIYRIYCQPKFLYGLEMIYISQNTLRELNSMQASLVKMNLGLSKFAKSSPLLDALRIESVKQLYHKFKILFVKQLQQIPFTNHLFKYLKEFYSDKNTPLQSFVQQTKETSKLISMDIVESPTKTCLEGLREHCQSTSEEFKNKILNLCTMMSENKQLSWYYRNIIAQALYN